MKYIYLIIRKVIITRNLKYLSKKYRLNNQKELISTKPGKVRVKGIRTLAEERNISFKKAQAIQAKAIAYNIKGKKKK